MTARIGRPPLPEEGRRNVLLSLRLTAAEHESLTAFATELKFSLSDYVRTVLLATLENDARAARPVTFTPEEQGELVAWAEREHLELADCSKAALLASARAARGAVKPWLDVESIARVECAHGDARKTIHVATVRFDDAFEIHLVIGQGLARALEARGVPIIDGASRGT